MADGSNTPTRDHATLDNVTSDQHHAQNHASRHATGGGDALAASDIGAVSEPTASDVNDVTASVSFGSSRTPNADRTVQVLIQANAVSDGAQSRISFDMDGTEVTEVVGEMVASGTGSNGSVQVPVSFDVPPGSSYTVRNAADPTGNNSIIRAVEITK